MDELDDLERAKQELAKLQKKINDLEDDLEDAADDLSDCEKRLKKKDEELSDLREEHQQSTFAKSQAERTLAEVQYRASQYSEDLKLKDNTLAFVQEILTAKPTVTEKSEEVYAQIERFREFVFNQVWRAISYGGDFDDFCTGEMTPEMLLEELNSGFEHWETVKKKSWIENKKKIAFVGEFSAGKTSIVNRVLSQDNPDATLLPVSMKATTAIPTYIASGKKTMYSFVATDNTQKSLSESTFKSVSKEVLGNVKGISSLIKYFVMNYKSPCLEHLSILDTPGFNSNDPEDAQRTIEVINECDALFWVLDVNAGTINRSSAQLIKEKLSKPLYIVINKVDTKAESEVTKVRELVRKTLKEEGIEVADFLSFSTETPVRVIFDAIDKVPSSEKDDAYLHFIENSIDNLLRLSAREVGAALNEVIKLEKQVRKAIDECNGHIEGMQDNCNEILSLPQYNSGGFFSSERYELSPDAASKMLVLLDEIGDSQMTELIKDIEQLIELQSQLNDAYQKKGYVDNRSRELQEVKEYLNEIIYENKWRRTEPL
ncbi:dynamin family protein [Porphyromonas sp.]|uniref:dynamin family protein n=1 Tax=Porphyromonas sp. TaxID=1924944 RepID=UPI00399620CD